MLREPFNEGGEPTPPPFDPSKPFAAAPISGKALPPPFDPSKPFSAEQEAPQWTKEKPYEYKGKTQDEIDAEKEALSPGSWVKTPKGLYQKPIPKPEAQPTDTATGVPLDYESGLEPAPAGPSAGGAFLRGAVRGIVPAAGGLVGMGAGAEAGAALGALGGPLAPITVPAGAIIGGLAGGYAGGWGTGKAQESALEQLPESARAAIGQSEEQRRADEEAHRYAAMAGELAPNLLAFRPGAVVGAAGEGATAVQRLMAHPATARIAGAGLMGGQEAATEAVEGRPVDPAAVAVAAGAGALMNRQTALGERLTGAGAAPIRAITGHGAAPVTPTETPATPSEPPQSVPAVGDTVSVAGYPGPMTVDRYTPEGLVFLKDENGDEHPMPVADIAQYRAEEPPAETPTQHPLEEPPALPADDVDNLFRASEEIQRGEEQKAAAGPEALPPSPEDEVAAAQRAKLAAVAGGQPERLAPPPEPLPPAPQPPEELQRQFAAWQAGHEAQTPPEAPRASTLTVAPEQRGVIPLPAITSQPPEPQRLVSWLKAQGGIIDEGGDIRHTLGGARYRPGLINNRNGMSLDDAALAAWEAGYFPDHPERPTINDLRNAIADDLRGNARYSELDKQLVTRYQDAVSENHEIDRISGETGIDASGLTRAQFWDAVLDHLSLEKEAKLSEERFAAFQTALGAHGEEGRFVGRPRTLEDMENGYRQAEVAAPARESPSSAGGPSPVAAGEAAREAGAGPGRGGPGVGRGPETEITDQGQQTVIPGTERTAQQAAAARDQQGRGMMRNAAAQAEPGGIFAPRESEEPSLFEGRAAPRGWESVDSATPQGHPPARDTTAQARQFHAAGTYEPSIIGGHAAARDYVFIEGTNSGHEFFAANDHSGQIVDAGTNGWRDAIKFSPDTLQRIWDANAAPEAIHHNHPSDHPLSVPDLMTLAAPGVGSVTAHGHDGRISSASLTPEAREALVGLSPGERQYLVAQAANQMERIAQKVTDPLFKRGMLPAKRAEEILREAGNRLLAASGIIDYISTRELPSWMTRKLAQELTGPYAGEIGDRLNRSAGALRPEEAMGRISETHADLAAGRSASASGNAGGSRGAVSQETGIGAQGLREEAGGAGLPPPVGPPGREPPEPPRQRRLPGLQPPSGGEPPDRPSAFGILKNGFSALTRDVQMKILPMAAGMPATRAIPKDFANAERAARYQSQSFIDRLKKGFTKDDWRRMWDIGDAASVAAQQRGVDAGERVLSVLNPKERKIMDAIDKYAKNLWQRGHDAGFVSGDALPFYTTRSIVNMGEDGRATRVDGTGEGSTALDLLGTNLRTQGPGRRKYLTAEETEAAAKARFGEQAELVRDIRAVPLALERFERAIATREMINDIRDIGGTLGRETISDSDKPGFFTIDHPAFKTYRPRFETDPSTGKTTAVRDESGNPVFDRVPIYVDREFEGPLRSVLRHQDGALYRGAMQLKAGAVSVIMNSPLIHNEVEWGRALPLMPGKVATGRIYFEGNAFRRGIPYEGVLPHIAGKLAGRQEDLAVNPEMSRAIEAGFVPIGHRGYMQDITGIAEEPGLHAGRSITAKLLGAGADLWSPALGTKVREAIDKYGDFWHNTLLWDRVADLQAGLYKNMRDHMIEKGLPEPAASMAAAHFANRYAGTLPAEAMSEMARKVANVVLFSRTFKLGNLGVMKDMFTGLPRDVQAQLSRDLGEVGRAQAVSYARAKAIRTFAVDIALFYAMNAALQTGLDMMLRDKSADDAEKEYGGLLSRAMDRIREHPLDALNPLGFLDRLSPLSENEPSKKNRVFWMRTSDGTGLYLRTPVGKIGEEFTGWLREPLEMAKRAEGTLMRPITNIFMNDKGFGRKVYDTNAEGIGGLAQNLGRIVWEFMRSQIPETQFGSLSRVLSGEAKEGDVAQAIAPFTGFTVSRGFPGGKEAGFLFDARKKHEERVRDAMPGINDLIRTGKTADAVKQMSDLGMSKGLINYHLKVAQNPSARISPSALKRFEREATPEERAAFQRMEQARQAQP